ncbi:MULTISPECIES: DUF4391 domain-containing protein [unclassified Rhodanobacter]|uniref:DUF4391 domain-containing protein n=1 Tax=unclassified Rhodanobacter TaxID=2621553 RepID=UPI00091CB3CC|nr:MULTISPECIES: DUF4391 domain-containing protein [unclassified Rhodanobacter]MBB6188210.1 hypothetical protein [Rhodanobacter sp. MP7CTX1]SHL78488.1 protein of unknown function [Rhodanobacter sp. OK091]
MTRHVHTALFAYPGKAAFGRVVPKAKLYEHGTVGARLKGLFAEQVEQIVWQYKLAPETTNLSASPGAPEIQVFSMRLRASELHHDILQCIDKAISFPLLFELHYEDRLQVVACYKRPSEAEASRWVCSDYFATDWIAAESPRAALPVALNLGGLYEQLLHALIPLTHRPKESLSDLVERVSKVRMLRKEMDKAVSQLATERQFNRKVTINATARELKHNLKLLESGE